ncbi:MAG: DUF2752 domain-containing protein [Mycobacteriaceae bacterium]|nr:DUF2752 domain-containing protein [Mycobacteriaceae bacterium]
MRTPILAGVATAGAVAVLHMRDPHVRGSYGLCPFHELTGWWCPACGGLRGMHDLTNGDLVAGLHSNVLLFPLLVAGVIVWARWLRLRWRGDARAPIRFTAGWTNPVLVLMAVFMVVRNTPWGHWLAPA